jgi:hypothetical protein
VAVAAAKRRYFPDRSYARMLHDIEPELGYERTEALRAFLRDDAPDAKRDDALALVEAMRSAGAGGS